MYLISARRKSFLAFLFTSTLLMLLACGKREDAKEESAVFIKANPPVNGTVDHSPGTLRVFFSELPEVSESELRLTGPSGDVGLVGLHTMGANDLMVGVEDYPLPNGDYTVRWTVTFAESGGKHSGSYQFSVAAPE